jgi:DNA mismatch repair protein MutL
MAKRIQVLPEQVTQKIAAGEVVERPASVVKELMENAIDARSSEIVVELKAGGLQLIRVIDNGEGIDQEDLPLALQRFATSKIRRAEDLYDIHTLGFRGEALPSIASVSHMIITSRVPQALSGTRIISEGGVIREISEIGCPMGTEVEVKDLFYNFPVKRKFLKSVRSELRQVLSQFLRLSLGRPSISFKLIHDGRVIQELMSSESVAVRIEAVLGAESYEHLRPVESEEGEVQISGFASLPSLSRGTTEGIYLFVNGRFVRDRMVSKAITDAYRHVIPSGKFPIVLLWMTLPPSTVDVNVHPTKAEVKFRDPERVFHAVHTVLRALHEPLPQPPGPSFRDELITGAKERGVPFPSLPISFHPGGTLSRPWTGEDVPKVREGVHSEWTVEPRRSLHILGQAFGTFLICEVEEGLLFIDQHAAHERLLFEKYKRQLETQSIPVVKLLIPRLVELSAEESLALESSLGELHSLGFEIDQAGQKVYAIRSVPGVFDQIDPQEVLREILQETPVLSRGGKGTDILHTLLVTLACHSAIRGRASLQQEELEQLVGDLSPLRLSATCPHGRPIFFFLSREELNRQFKRSR